MMYLITFTQVLIWFIIDLFLFLYCFRWNVFLQNPHLNGFTKNKFGLVRRVSNGEKYKEFSKNKYITAFKNN